MSPLTGNTEETAERINVQKFIRLVSHVSEVESAGGIPNES